METLRLTDGRTLAFDDVGDPDGLPVLYQPGWMFGRLGRHPDDSLAAEAGVRLVSVDRPGYGGSTPQAVRTMRGSAHDTEQLVEHVGFDRFAILGYSGGGVHALAAASYLGDRVTHAVTVSTPAPYDLPGAGEFAHWLALLPHRLRHVPPLRRAWFGAQARQASTPSAYVDGVAKNLCAEDRALFADPTLRASLEQIYADAWAQGPTGVDSDHAVISQPGFRLAEVHQHVDLYHGKADTFVRPGAAPFLADRLPDAGVHLVPGGHFCVFTQWAELLSAVAATTR